MTPCEAVEFLKDIVVQYPDGGFEEESLNYYSWYTDDGVFHALIIQGADEK